MSRNESIDSSCSSTCSQLSKEDIDEIINSPYETGYTYTESAAYLRDGPAEFRHPQLCRRIRSYMNAPFDPLAGRTDIDDRRRWLGRMASGVAEASRFPVRHIVNVVIIILRTLLIILAAPLLYAINGLCCLAAGGRSLAHGVTGSSAAVGAAHGVDASAHFFARVSQQTAHAVRETLVYAVAAVVFVVMTVLSAVYASLVHIGAGVVCIVVTVLRTIYTSLVYVGASVGWLASGRFLRAVTGRAADRSFVFSSPVFTSTPVYQPVGSVNLLRRKRPQRLTFPAAAAANNFASVDLTTSGSAGGIRGSERWRHAGRLIGQLLRLVFWTLAAIAFVALLYVAISYTRDKIFGVSARWSSASSSSDPVVTDYDNWPRDMSFQTQIDAIRAELRDFTARMNTHNEVAVSRLNAIEREERYERLITEMRLYQEHLTTDLSVDVRQEIQAAVAAAVTSAVANGTTTVDTAAADQQTTSAAAAINESAYLLRVRQLIHEQIRLYDADKTGLADYALESSGGAIASIRCTVPYSERSRTQKIFGIPLWHSSYSPRSVIQRKGYGASAGECWAFVGGHGYLTIKLSNRIDVTAVSYEHLPVQLSPDGHIQTAPRDFLVYSYQNVDDLDSRYLLGNFTYQADGEPLQMFHVARRDPVGSPVVELETLSNHGAMITCLYRFRVHGQLRKEASTDAGDAEL